MIVTVNGDPALPARGQEDPARLIETQGVDPDAGRRGEILDPIVHAKILRVFTRIVTSRWKWGAEAPGSGSGGVRAPVPPFADCGDERGEARDDEEGLREPAEAGVREEAERDLGRSSRHADSLEEVVDEQGLEFRFTGGRAPLRVKLLAHEEECLFVSRRQLEAQMVVTVERSRHR